MVKAGEFLTSWTQQPASHLCGNGDVDRLPSPKRDDCTLKLHVRRKLEFDIRCELNCLENFKKRYIVRRAVDHSL